MDSGLYPSCTQPFHSGGEEISSATCVFATDDVLNDVIVERMLTGVETRSLPAASLPTRVDPSIGSGGGVSRGWLLGLCGWVVPGGC